MVSIEGRHECKSAGLVQPLRHLVVAVVLSAHCRRPADTGCRRHAGVDWTLSSVCNDWQGAALRAYRDGMAALGKLRRLALRLSTFAGQGQCRQFGLDDL